MSVTLNPKYQDLLQQENVRYFIVTGGRGSGKSYGVNTVEALRTFTHNSRTLFTRYTMRSAAISIIPEFLEKLEALDSVEHFNITKDQITNKLSGGSILFRGIKTSSGDQTASLKSLQGISTWILDEAEELTDEEVFDRIDLSVREKGIQNRVVLIMNPATKEHWIYQRFFESAGVEPGFNGVKGNVCYIHTTYQDNLQNLSESYLNQIEEIKKRRPEKYKYQILGGWRNKAEGVIFNNWEVGKFEPRGEVVYGMDFGYSIDPTTLVATYIDSKRKKIYLKLLLYKPHLTTSDIYDIASTKVGRGIVVADSAEPRLISELKARGMNMQPAKKGPDSIKGGIAQLLDYDLIVDEDSVDLIKELNNYCWLSKGDKPVDNYNHCFVGSTLVTTIDGQKRIDQIKVGDLVLTSNGYKPVLKVFDNGLKRVQKYSMQLDTKVVSLTCTDSHKVKTEKQWIEISQLKQGANLYLHKPSTEKHTTYTKVSDILVKVVKGFTQRFGNITKEPSQKATTFTILTETPKIIGLRTLRWLKNLYTCDTKVKSGLKKTLNGLKTFTQKESKPLKNGTSQKRVESGIKNTGKSLGKTESTKQRCAKSAKKNTKQGTQASHCTAITTAKLERIDVTESREERVFDLMIADNHEYFANGVLVHNCIDAVRYAVSFQIDDPNKGKYSVL